MGLRAISIGWAAVLVLGACVQRPAPLSDQPLRDVRTVEEQAYIACVREDPFFRTQRCQRLRSAIAADPFPGVFGR